MQDRRDFLRQLALLTGSVMVPFPALSKTASDKWGELLPLRKLGKTKEKVSMLGVGGFHVGWTSERDAQEIIETAIAGGIRFFDSAESYSKGESENRYGKYLVPKYRDDVFIMTKTGAKNGELALQHLEDSLRRMKCDYIDLWQVHALSTPDDVNKRIENEVLEVFEKAKAQGKVKHIGFTGHQNPFAHKQMLDKTQNYDLFETVQMPVNVIDSHFHSFIKNVLPQALDRNMGILGMKSLSDGRFFSEKKRLGKIQWESKTPLIPDTLSVKEALYFVWSLPVSVLITGAENKILLQEKIDLARNFKQLNAEQRSELVERVFEKSGNAVEYYKKLG